VGLNVPPYRTILVNFAGRNLALFFYKPFSYLLPDTYGSFEKVGTHRALVLATLTKENQ
jgi:hypothetical protein